MIKAYDDSTLSLAKKIEIYKQASDLLQYMCTKISFMPGSSPERERMLKRIGEMAMTMDIAVKDLERNGIDTSKW